MTTEVKTSLQVAVAGGPLWKINTSDQVEAYDVIDVTIDAGAADKVVEVQPAAAAARVNVLVIQSDLYGDDITYKASDGHDDSDPLTLHGPHFFGRAVASLFGVNVASLKFSNADAKSAHVQILVGRDATP
jgi:hypothetical protein